LVVEECVRIARIGVCRRAPMRMCIVVGHAGVVWIGAWVGVRRRARAREVGVCICIGGCRRAGIQVGALCIGGAHVEGSCICIHHDADEMLLVSFSVMRLGCWLCSLHA